MRHTAFIGILFLGALLGFGSAELWPLRGSDRNRISTIIAEEERASGHEIPTSHVAQKLAHSRKQTLLYREGLERAVETEFVGNDEFCLEKLARHTK